MEKYANSTSKRYSDASKSSHVSSNGTQVEKKYIYIYIYDHRRQSSGPGGDVSPDCAILRGFLAKEKSEWHPLEHKDGKT